MAYQDIDKAFVRPPRPFNVEDEPTKRYLEFLAENYDRLAFEVTRCHNLVWNFSAVVGNGLTSLAIVLPAPYPDALYYVGAEFSFNNGGYWTTLKTTTGFTLNWATASVGAQSVRFGIIG